jgi:hypothetical protein
MVYVPWEIAVCLSKWEKRQNDGRGRIIVFGGMFYVGVNCTSSIRWSQISISAASKYWPARGPRYFESMRGTADPCVPHPPPPSPTPTPLYPTPAFRKCEARIGNLGGWPRSHLQSPQTAVDPYASTNRRECSWYQKHRWDFKIRKRNQRAESRELRERDNINSGE